MKYCWKIGGQELVGGCYKRKLKMNMKQVKYDIEHTIEIAERVFI